MVHTERQQQIREIDNNEKDKHEKTVFILNFRKNCKEENLRSLLIQYGTIVCMRLPKEDNTNTAKWKGYGYIEYATKAEAAKCIEGLNGKAFQGKVLTVQKYRTKDEMNETNTVYVNGLKGMTEKEARSCLESIFAREKINNGNIVEVRFSKDFNNKLKGFAYVEFDNENSAQVALTYDKLHYNNDRIIEVQKYDRNDNKKKKKKIIKQNQNHNKKINDTQGQDNKKSILSLKPRSILTSSKSAIKDKKTNVNSFESNQEFRKFIGL